MNPKTLYNYFSHAIKFNDNTEINELREMVQSTTRVFNKMPDKILLDVFRRKLFSEKMEIPPDKKEKMEYLEEYFRDVEDLFKI